ncbi:MAG: AI-2E family transporter [Blastocatellia bacterium]
MLNPEESSPLPLSLRRWSHSLFLLALFLLVGWLGYRISEPFLKPIITAVLLAIVYYPIHHRLDRFLRRPALAALTSTLLVLSTILLPFLLLGAAVRQELADLYRSLSEQSVQDGGWGPWLTHVSERLTAWLQRYLGTVEIDLKTLLLERIRGVSQGFLNDAASLLGDLISFVVDGVIAFFTLFFLFRDGGEIYDRLAGLVPLQRGQLDRLRHEIGRTITASVYGGLAVALSQGGLTALAFWAIGLPSPVLWGIAAGLFSFVPLVGPTIIWGPAVISLFVQGSWLKGALLLAWGAGVIGLADNVVRPFVISSQVRFYPLFVFLSLLGGVQAFGLLGLFIGPVVLALAQALVAIWREENQPSTGVPTLILPADWPGESETVEPSGRSRIE